MQCKKNDITPKFAKIGGRWKGQAEKKIIGRAEKAIMNAKIREIVAKKEQLRREVEQTKAEIKKVIPQEIYDEIVKLSESKKVKEQEKSRKIQRDKYYKLKYGEKYEDYHNKNTPDNSKKHSAKGTIDKSKWVINISKRKLTPIEEKVLQKGAGFAIVEKEIQYEDFIAAAEIAGSNLPKAQSLAMKADITELLLQAKPNESNLSAHELNALKRLKKDKDIVITPADKGKALVVMDRTSYISKMEEKLSDTTTYKPIEIDPTQQLRQEIIEQLLTLQKSGVINDKLYDELYPHTAQVPRAYGSPKVHKEGYPLREIVDGTNSVTKRVDKYVSRIIKTYTLDSEYSIKNAKDFVQKMENKNISKDLKMISFDVAALYPSVPQEEALNLFEECLRSDENLKKKTPIPAKELMLLFRTCLKKTYFVFNFKLYQQIDGLAIGASSSVFLAELFMMRLEKKALRTFAHPPETWYRYVDDTFTYMLEKYINDFLLHLNQQHERIKFTMELEVEREIPFLDTTIRVEEDGTITSRVYRKKTHTNQFLNFQSNHHLKQKVGIVSTLMKRLEWVSKEEDQEEERKLLQRSFRACGYPEWTVQQKKKKTNKMKVHEEESIAKITVPYNKGLSERFARIMRKYKVETIHKPTSTIKNVLCSKAKDKLHPMDKPGAIYSIRCHEHNSHYIGETGRMAKERMYNHRVINHNDATRTQSLDNKEKEKCDNPPPLGTRRSQRNVERKDYKAMHTGSGQLLSTGNTIVSEHMATKDHKEGDIDIKLLGFEPNWRKRKIKEAIVVKKLNPDLNGNEGSYQLSPIYDPIPSRIAREARLDNQRSNDVIKDSNSGNRLKPLDGATQQQHAEEEG